ncbi:hypothetical protein JMJ77_0013776 [Colletotrichum scovillei]|uniref:Uncharacterized protein n=1 Tax=Colletotrichum scovillei TaxID=1209932 RepID=A0A9P7UA61_9PEZI|nr:hypothetical protein JMJ77_0013776 [Colletotrichum scovillei]KAG7065294.1 hypothetical protein JMJ78_0012050 [Colletotrichum scovillei]KAG7067897.1 hypothetical protein JMJ76_0007596 [Colletotrichum scovillei]
MHVFGALTDPPADDCSVFSSPFWPMWPQTRGGHSIRDGAVPNFVAEDVGGSEAPTVAQLRRCASATYRQPRDDIRAQSSRSYPPHAPTRSAPAHRTPHRKAATEASSQSVSAARGKKRLSRFFALVSDPVQTPSRPNLLQSSP